MTAANNHHQNERETMNCPNCDHDCKTKFCGNCGAEMPVPELEEILKILLRNAVHNSDNAVERQKAVVAKQDGKPVDPKLVAKVDAAIKLRDYWQRLADAQAKAIEDLKPKGPETKRELTPAEKAFRDRDPKYNPLAGSVPDPTGPESEPTDER